MTSEPKLYTWGRGVNGQLGHGGAADAAAPKPISQPLAIVSCSHFHSVGVSPDGVAYSWGRGALGLLGHGDEADAHTPRRIESLASMKVQAISCGAYHSAAVTAVGGAVMVWGWALVSEGGKIEESFHTSPVPIPVLGGLKVSGVACGCYATAVWTEDGKLLTWGRGASGQLGHGGLADEPTPRPVAALGEVKCVQAALGGMQELGFMLVRGADGRVFSCGAAEKGRLGRASVGAAQQGTPAVGGSTPANVPGAVPLNDAGAEGGPLASFAVDIDASDHHAAVVGHSGALIVWGSNEFGRLGLDPSVSVATSPKLVSSLSHVRCKAVACSAFSTTVVVSNGTVFSMGRRDASASAAQLSKPTAVPLPDLAAGIAGGGYHIGVLVGGPPARDFTSLKLGGAAPPATVAAAPPGGVELPELLRGLVSDELVELLLADCKGAPALQLRHELHMLRELLAAEHRKLDALPGGAPKGAGINGDAPKKKPGLMAGWSMEDSELLHSLEGGEATVELSPSADAWTELEPSSVLRPEGSASYAKSLAGARPSQY